MSFIRSKQIPPGSGNWYNYEVMGIRQGKKVRQKVLRYLGRADSSPSPLSGSHAPISLASTFEESATPITNPTTVQKMKTPASLIASALGMYYGGMPLDAIQQQFRQDHTLDMSESNYWGWVKRFTKEAVRQCASFRPNVSNEWVADETYMKLGKRTVYFWDIIDPKTNYLLATHVSFSRGGTEARILMKKAAQRAGKTPKIVRTDKLRSYIVGIEDAFGADTKHVQGGPFKTVASGESTAEIERFHRTLEQRTRVFEKFKDIASIRLLTDGWLINYNFMKQNEGCGNIPPAQAANGIVPLKDWNDVVIPEGAPDLDYQVVRHTRRSVKKGYLVVDATLTPIEASGGVVPK
jgi:putative transposase